MPKKLIDCIKKVMDSGKSESEAWAICQHSTGLKKEKHAETIQQVVELANVLDEAGFREEAIVLDNTLVKEAQWQWFKEKGQQLKDWVATEKEMDPALRKNLTTLRQNHWNLIKQLNSARTMLNNTWKSMGRPEYIRDLKNVIRYLQRDLLQATESAKQAGEAARTLQQQQQQQQQATQTQTSPNISSTTPGAASTFDSEKTQVIPGQATFDSEKTQVISNVNFLEKLLKVASRLEEQGEISFAHEVDNIFLQQVQVMAAPIQCQAAVPPVKEWGSRLQDWVLGKTSPAVQNLSKIHWDLMDKLNNTYNRLQTARQNIANSNAYVDTFLTEMGTLEQDLGTVLQSIQQLDQLARQVPAHEQVPEQPKTQQMPEAGATPAQAAPQKQVVTPQAVTPATLPSTEQSAGESAVGTPPKGGAPEAIRPSLKNLTPEQRQHIMSLIYEYRKQNKGQGV